MPEFKTEPLIVPFVSGLLPEGERDHQQRGALASPRPEPMRNRVPTREVECYECGRRSHVPAAALSASCIHCHAHLNMGDVEMRSGAGRLTVRTLGDVTVPADAVLSQVSVVCRNMKVLGRVSGNIRCSHDLRFCSSCRVEGPIKARHLYVEKGAEVELLAEATVREAEVQGTLVANLKALAHIKVAKNGVLRGQCDAGKGIIVEPGGEYEH